MKQENKLEKEVKVAEVEIADKKIDRNSKLGLSDYLKTLIPLYGFMRVASPTGKEFDQMSRPQFAGFFISNVAYLGGLAEALTRLEQYFG